VTGNGQVIPVIQSLRQLVLTGNASGLSDGQLLEQFVTRHDEAAFAVLVRRHGSMVWAVCQRVSQNPHDAEDAFQATFLVLVRKASAIGKPEFVGSWLHGVAYRVAMKVRAQSSRWKGQESLPEDLVTGELLPELAWRELQLVLDEEVNRLPAKYRAPFVLCYLEGKTYTQAARQLGWAAGTVSGRLARSRELLRARLARRGFGFSAGLLGTVLCQQAASAAVPVVVLNSTIKAAATVAAGGAATSVVSAKIAALTEGVLKTMVLSKLRTAVIGVVILGLVGLTGVMLAQLQADEQRSRPNVEIAPLAANPDAAVQKRNNSNQDPGKTKPAARAVALQFVFAFLTESDSAKVLEFFDPDADRKGRGKGTAVEVAKREVEQPRRLRESAKLREIVFFSTKEDVAKLAERYPGETMWGRLPAQIDQVQDGVGCLVVNEGPQEGTTGLGAFLFKKVGDNYRIVYMDDN
jgi:RNA polymerase sigma factor (sigma-70 family)